MAMKYSCDITVLRLITFDYHEVVDRAELHAQLRYETPLAAHNHNGAAARYKERKERATKAPT
jgi:hypothetical protein